MESCIFSFYHGFFSEKSNNKCKTVQLDLQNSNCRNCTNNSPENFHPITCNLPAEFLQFMRHYRFCGCFLHNCKCYMPYLKNFHPNGYPLFVCKFCTKNGTGRISAYNISCQKKYKERTRVTRYYNANHYRYAISCLNPSGFRANKLRWHLRLWYLVKNPNYVVPLLCTYRFRVKKGGQTK